MPRTRQSSKIVIGCMLVIVIGLVGFVGAALILRTMGGQAQATRADWQAAQRKWQRSGPANYDITVEVGGRRAAVYRVEVRDGVARSASLDGRPLTQSRLFSIWSVPGMFDTLQREFDLQAAGSSAKAGAPREMRLYCQWNDQYGYPQSYRRLAVGGDDISWQVTEFTTLSDSIRE